MRDAHLLSADEAIKGPDLRFIDGSWFLPPAAPGRLGYERERVPGAVFFDIDAVADRRSDLPHMLPAPEAFADAVGALGIAETDDIVVYDQQGLFSAPRVWWTFRAMGAERVRVLDGGLPAWRAAGGRVETGPHPTPRPRTFTARPDPRVVADRTAVEMALKVGQPVLDARPADRFVGRAPEPRDGLRSGHMPGATNVPMPALVRDGHLRPDTDLRQRLAAAGLGTARDGIASCGSGVTAATLVLAASVTGLGPLRLYDGSWAEWGRPGVGAVVTGD